MCIVCLGYISFLPASAIASVLCTCISMYMCSVSGAHKRAYIHVCCQMLLVYGSPEVINSACTCMLKQTLRGSRKEHKAGEKVCLVQESGATLADIEDEG